jgi:hypothetical protein
LRGDALAPDHVSTSPPFACRDRYHAKGSNTREVATASIIGRALKANV